MNVPFEVFKEVFDLIVSKVNHKTRRKLGLKQKLLSVDSTTISVGQSRLKWGKFHGEKSAIKLHVGYDVSTNLPTKVIETIARKHDGPVGEGFEDKNLNVKRLFGTNKNAVSSQLYCALIAFVLIHIMYEKVALNCTRFKLTRIEFVKRLLTSTFKVEVLVTISKLLNKKRQLKGKL